MEVRFLTPGFLKLPGWLAGPGTGWRSQTIPSIVGVLSRADGKLTLVDCGFARAEIEAPRQHLGIVRQYLFPIYDADGQRRQRTVAVCEQLAQAGLNPADVTSIIATHLHLDHIGGFVDFPNAEILTTSDELASARKRGAIGGYLHAEALGRSGRLRPLNWTEAERHGFPRHHDLFGDGRVLLLDAKGHTAGSMAILITSTGNGASYLMAGDAAYSVAEFRTARMSLLMRIEAYRRDWVRTTWEHLRRVDSEGGVQVIPAHDPECLRCLPLLASS